MQDSPFTATTERNFRVQTTWKLELNTVRSSQMTNQEAVRREAGKGGGGGCMLTYLQFQLDFPL